MAIVVCEKCGVVVSIKRVDHYNPTNRGHYEHNGITDWVCGKCGYVLGTAMYGEYRGIRLPILKGGPGDLE